MRSVLPIDDVSRVAEARRLAMSVARFEGLDETAIQHAGLVATEIATNLNKHAQGGEIHISGLSAQGNPGVDILSIDRGPGMANLDACLRDGWSTTGTAGTGFGAVSRISSVFDAYSEPGKGTVVVARIYGTDAPEVELNRLMDVGFAGRPVAGEEVSGDAWAVKQDDSNVIFMVADGLGHGLLAADASTEAVSAFRKTTDTAPSLILDRVHRALRGGRGAAVAVAALDLKARQIHYAGLGNIAGVIISPVKTQNMISHHGTAGHEARNFQEFVYPFPERAVLAMHSDGLATSWNLASHPGLTQRHPSLIAGVLYRDSSRSRDDVCVVVAKDRLL